MVRALLVLPFVLACATGCGSQSSTGPKSRTLQAAAFVTTVPASWHERHLQGKGDDLYFLGSGSKAPNDLGIVAGGIGMTIGTQPVSQVHNPASAAVAIKRTVGTPKGAARVTLTEPIAKAQLGGADAATSQFTYTFRGTDDVQSDLVALHGSKLVVIEVNSGPSLEPSAHRVFSELVKTWRWRGPTNGAAQ